MGKKYIRRNISLANGGGAKFECTKCAKLFLDKQEFKTHFEEKHEKTAS